MSVTSKTHSSVTLQISQPTLQDRNGLITGYSVHFTQVSSGLILSFTASQVGQPFTATTLLPYTTYSYTVAARTVNGTGPASASVTITTAQAGKSACSLTAQSCVVVFLVSQLQNLQCCGTK